MECVTAKAIHVLHLSKCARRYGSDKKTKRLVGLVVTCMKCDKWAWLYLQLHSHSQIYVIFLALLHQYPLFIGSLERSDRAESEISRTFEKNNFFGGVMTERKNRILRIQYMATWCDGTFDVNMTSSEVVRTRHHIRRFLRTSLVLKIKPNTGQTLGNSDKIERRKIWQSEGRALLTIETLKTFYCCIEMPLCGTNATHYVPKL